MSIFCKECGCDAEGLLSSFHEMDTLLGEAQTEIDRLQAQRQEDADLIEAQKREIEVLHGIRDEAERLMAEIEQLQWILRDLSKNGD